MNVAWLRLSVWCRNVEYSCYKDSASVLKPLFAVPWLDKGLDSRRNRPSTRGRYKWVNSSPVRSDLLWVLENLPAGLQRPRSEANHMLPTIAEFMNEQSYVSRNRIQFHNLATHSVTLQRCAFFRSVQNKTQCERAASLCLFSGETYPICSIINRIYTGCPRRNVPDFGRVFLMLKYTDITQNTYIQIWTVTEIMAREVWNFDSCYTLIDYQIKIKTGRIMWFL